MGIGTPIEIDIEVGETIRIIQGPFENFLGRVIAVDKERQKIKLIVNLMARTLLRSWTSSKFKSCRN